MNFFSILDKFIYSPKKRNVMLEDSQLDSLKGINGYKAAAIADYTGELLISDNGTLAGDLAVSAATMNDIFRSAHKASKDLDLGVTQMMQLETTGDIVLMACSGEDARAHIHVFAIFDKEGNRALAKIAMDKLVPQVVDSLTS